MIVGAVYGLWRGHTNKGGNCPDGLPRARYILPLGVTVDG